MAVASFRSTWAAPGFSGLSSSGSTNGQPTAVAKGGQRQVRRGYGRVIAEGDYQMPSGSYFGVLEGFVLSM